MPVTDTEAQQVDKSSAEKLIIAIQGFEGSYHDIAARKYFGNSIDYIMCASFDKVFQSLESNKANYGLMAIENSVAGTIIPNYALLRESNYQVIGEVYLRIEHQLMTLPGQTIEELKIVQSHPMALAQCRKLFRQYPHLETKEASDTALCAKELLKNQKPHIGVIASKLAADLFDLEIVAKSVEDNKRNFTRFLVLEEKNVYNQENTTANKASVCFHLGHRAGTLAAVLSVLASHYMNLSKIQSLPLVGKEWEYFFHLDIEFEEYDLFLEAMEAIAPMVKQFKILGEYKRGIKP